MKWIDQPSQPQQGGGSGGIIIRHVAADALQNPQIHGQLPVTTQSSLQPILPKHPSMWTESECEVVGRAFMWAICNLK